MRRLARLTRTGALAWALALTLNTAVTGMSYARPNAGTHTPAAGQYEQVQVTDDGSLKLLPSAPPAPQVYGSFQHFGYAVSPAQQFDAPFRSLRLEYDATVPSGAALRLDLRASADGVRWTPWEVDLTSGASAIFATPARFAQYRATLLGNADGGPVISAVRLVPVHGPAIYTAMHEVEPIAPTFRVHATRMGMVGGRTANGHRIKPRDHFVSLPSWRSLSSKGGNEYMVRITYNGRSSVAPVYDVGPWNVHDNYWDEEREKFNDLPRGWPQDHAAYFDKYNGGWAEKGKVRFPTAVDVGDGVWWDDLKIRGDRAEVEVTFLWLGRDPLAAEAEQSSIAQAPVEASPPEAAKQPSAAPGEIVVEDSGPAFNGHAEVTWYSSSRGCGSSGKALWTYTTTNPEDSENTGRWQPELPAESLYDVYAFIPACSSRKPGTTSANYVVQHRDGTQQVTIDQSAAAGGWVLLGRFPFRAGRDGFVELRDVTGDSMRTLWYDAVKWVPLP